MCPQPEMDRKKENMSFDVLQKVVDDCKGKPLKKINLFWMGDSTVDKNMIEKIRIIRKNLPNVKLYLSTNAQLLSEKRSRILLEEDLLDVINFDIDGLNKNTFEGIRVKLDFDVVTKNVNNLYSAFKNAMAPSAMFLAIRAILASPTSCLDTQALLINTNAVANLIREKRTFEIEKNLKFNVYNQL